MKEKVNFLIGSKAFFLDYPDFDSKDTDILHVMSTWKFKSPVINFKSKGVDRFFVADVKKDVLLKNTLESGIALRVGKFLVPAFANYIKLTIKDLKQLEPLFEKLDDKHQYEKIIYDSYIENNSFTLTKELLDKAYESYKKSHENTEK